MFWIWWMSFSASVELSITITNKISKYSLFLSTKLLGKGDQSFVAVCSSTSRR